MRNDTQLMNKLIKTIREEFPTRTQLPLKLESRHIMSRLEILDPEDSPGFGLENWQLPGQGGGIYGPVMGLVDVILEKTEVARRFASRCVQIKRGKVD